MEECTEMIHDESKIKSIQKRSAETSGEVPDKKFKLSPSPLMELPNEIWMKILGYLPACDILKNFNLTCKHFHSLAMNPGAIKFLRLKNITDTGQYQDVVKVLKRSKTLKRLSIKRCTSHMNHILAHALRSNHLKTLKVSDFGGCFSKKNAEDLKYSNIEILKMNNVALKDDAIQQIGAMKTLKFLKISNYENSSHKKMPELIKSFVNTNTRLETLALLMINPIKISSSILKNFLEKTETLKKLYIHCCVTKENENDLNEVKWNVNPNMEECFLFGNKARSPLKIEFGQAMPKLTILALSSIDEKMLSVFCTQSFPLLERLYLRRGYGALKPDLQVIYNILKNCPNLKSVQLTCFDFSDPNPVGEFLHGVYKDFNAYIDILTHQENHQFEDYLEKTDLATFEKYKKLKVNYLDSKWHSFGKLLKI